MWYRFMPVFHIFIFQVLADIWPGFVLLHSCFVITFIVSFWRIWQTDYCFKLSGCVTAVIWRCVIRNHFHACVHMFVSCSWVLLCSLLLLKVHKAVKCHSLFESGFTALSGSFLSSHPLNDFLLHPPVSQTSVWWIDLSGNKLFRRSCLCVYTSLSIPAVFRPVGCCCTLNQYLTV